MNERLKKGYDGEIWFYQKCLEDPIIRKHDIKWQNKCKFLSYEEYKSLNARHESKGRPDFTIGNLIAVESKNTSAIISKEWLGDWYDRFDSVYHWKYKFILTPNDTRYTSFAQRGINFEEGASDIFIVTRDNIMNVIRNILEDENVYLKLLKKSFEKVKSIILSSSKEIFTPLYSIGITTNSPIYCSNYCKLTLTKDPP